MLNLKIHFSQMNQFEIFFNKLVHQAFILLKVCCHDHYCVIHNVYSNNFSILFEIEDQRAFVKHIIAKESDWDEIALISKSSSCFFCLSRGKGVEFNEFRNVWF